MADQGRLKGKRAAKNSDKTTLKNSNEQKSGSSQQSDESPNNGAFTKFRGSQNSRKGDEAACDSSLERGEDSEPMPTTVPNFLVKTYEIVNVSCLLANPIDRQHFVCYI